MVAQVPGIYLGKAIAACSTTRLPAVAGFVGQAERGPVNQPRRISAWPEFRSVFGDGVPHGYLAFAVHGFFLNGGKRCYVLRVADEAAAAARAELNLAGVRGPSMFLVEAVDPGAWGNALSVLLEESAGPGLRLASLADALSAGAVTARVAGNLGLQIGARDQPGKAYEISLIHPTEPIRQDRVPVLECGLRGNRIVFGVPAMFSFPKGTQILGKGLRLTVRDRHPGREVLETFERLTLRPDSDRYICNVVNGQEPKPASPDPETRASRLIRIHDLRANPFIPAVPGRDKHRIYLRGGRDGNRDLDLGYYTGYRHHRQFFPGISGRPSGTGKAGDHAEYGLARLGLVEEIGMVAVPDLVLPDLAGLGTGPGRERGGAQFGGPDRETGLLAAGQAQVLKHCQALGDRFAVLDGPPLKEKNDAVALAKAHGNRFLSLTEARNGAVYHPWIRCRNPYPPHEEVLVPPSGHICGVYARTAGELGLIHEPANLPITGVIGMETLLTEADQAVLNPLGINCLRVFPGGGYRVWGGRTLSRDPRWQYISTRQTYLSLVRLIRQSLRRMVFEPNGPPLWDRITAQLTVLCREFFLAGALAGTRMDEAFFVRCDAETNPPALAAQGAVAAFVGFAPTRPAEFIVIDIRKRESDFAVAES